MKVVSLVGGLGNQMFQYALALRLKEEFPNEEINFWLEFFKKNVHHGLGLEDIFGLDITNHNISKQDLEAIYQEEIQLLRKIRKFFFSSHPKYDSRIFQVESDYFEWIFDMKHSTHYSGYWQNPSYFPRNLESLYSAFSFLVPQNNKIQDFLEEVATEKSVAIHIRRGDYLEEAQRDRNFLASSPYYEKALEYIQREATDLSFYVFSDDISWCKQQKIFTQLTPVVFVDFLSDRSNYFYSIDAMSKSHYTLIGNSSFSWWGGYLNRRKDATVLCPEIWMKAKSESNTALIMDDWKKISIS